MSGNIRNLEEALDISGDDSDDDVVVYRPTTTPPASRLNRSDDSPLDLGGVNRRGGWRRYGPALSALVPVRPFKGEEASEARVDQAGCLSFITYGWIFGYLWSAFRGLIPHDQTWACSPYDAAGVNVSRLERLWKAELEKPRPSLFRCVLRFFRTRLAFAAFVFLFCLAFGFIGPSCLVKAIIEYAEEAAKNGSAHEERVRGVGLAASLFVVELCRVLFYGACWAISYRTGIRVRGALLGLLYKKLIRLRSLGAKTPAEIVNMFGNDGQRIFDAVTFAPLVLMGPLVLVAGLVYLLVTIGPWSLLGILVFFLFDVFQAGLGISMVRFRKTAIAATEKRVSAMGEVIRCIKTIKMHAWERPFIDRVSELREVEVGNLRKAGYAQSLAIAAGPVVPACAAILTFLAFIAAGNDLHSSDAFSAITIFFVMVFGIRMIPYGMRYVGEASVGLRSIQTLLMLPEVDTVRPAPSDDKLALEIQDATFAWEDKNSKKPGEKGATVELEPLKRELVALKNIDLTVEKGQLVGICGPVGGGKSALLSSIIGQMVQQEGSITVGGRLAYTAQEPWIQNASLKDNILFGQVLDDQRYYKVIHACALNQDIATMPANDQTEIGERGATLSGGQKARVALARAIYANREVYLLDDVMRALDGPVGEHVFHEAVRGLLRDKTVLFVSSNLKHLDACDSVLLMVGGAVVGSGPHKDLIETCEDYADFVDEQREKALHKGTSIDDLLGGLEGAVPKTPLINRSESEQLLWSERYEKRARTGSNLSMTVSSIMDIPAAVEAGQLVEAEEDSGLGSIPASVYARYIQCSGGYILFSSVLIMFALNVGSTVFSTVWLSEWLKEGAIVQARTNQTLSEQDDFQFYAIIYGMSVVLLAVTSAVKATLWVKISLSAATRLQTQMLHRLMHGAMRFFDSTPTGRILNRFSKDLDEIDVKLPFTFETFLQNSFTIIGYLATIAFVFPWFLVACVPLSIIFVIFVACFRAGIRHLKRSENISRSPLFDHISASLEGLGTIQAFGRTRDFQEKLKELLDDNSAAMFMYQSAMRWLAVWLDLLVVLITFTTALLVVLQTGAGIPPAYAGMALAFAIQMSGIFQFAVRMQTELEAKMTSVERIDYYCEHIETEGDWVSRENPPPLDWPATGRLSFRDVRLKYRENLPLALKGIDLEISSTDKVGIVGRTGSGKSSLGVALFRLYPLSGGFVQLDSLDTTAVGLHELRQKMEAIPQDPVLFNATFRFNLDPMRRHTDAELWEALDKTFLKALVTAGGGLDAEVRDGGRGLSSGQRQLLCLARALLRHVRLLLLDEATSALDAATDALIRECLAQHFANCTTLVIAHRLHSIMHCDKIVFMDQGKVVEFEHPKTLLEDPRSRFAQMSRRTAALPTNNAPDEALRLKISSL